MSLESLQPADINPQTITEGEVVEPLPQFTENMLEIGRIVSHFGGKHPGYPFNVIRKIESSSDETRGFEAEVYLEPPDDPHIVLNKRGARIPGMIGYRCEHLEISYRPDTRTSLRVQDKTEFPQSTTFEKPPSKLSPGNIFVNHGRSLFLWMRAEFLGQNIVRFLDVITSQALTEFQGQASRQLSQPKIVEPKENII